MSEFNKVQLEVWQKKIDKYEKKLDYAGLEKYKNVIQATAGVDATIKAEAIRKCDEVIETIKEKVSDNIEEKTGVKNLKLRKKIVTYTIIGLTAVAGIGLVSCGVNQANKNNNKSGTKTESSIDDVDNTQELDETLAFDPQNTEVMTSNINNFLSDSLGKGLYLDAETLNHDLDAFIDFYVALNIDEIGPGYLTELYQSDNKSYLDVFNNYVRWAMNITDAAMMSSVDNSFDITSLVSNKEEAEMLQTALNLLPQIRENGLAGNKEALKGNANDMKAILNEALFSEKNASYSSSSKIMLAYIAMNADSLLINYKDIKVVDDDMRKVMYEDAEIGCAMSLREYKLDGKDLTDAELLLLLNASKKNQSGVDLAGQLEKKFDQVVLLYNSIDKDYSTLTSKDDVIEDLASTIDLSLYKANQEYREYVDITHEINFPTVKVPENSIIVNNGNSYVAKEELNKYNAKTEEEYKEAVKVETEEQLKEETTFEDTEGNITTGEEAYDAMEAALAKNDGYNDGFMKLPSNPPSKYASEYKAGYAIGAADRKKQDEAAKNDVKVEEEKLDKPIEESTEIIESGNLNSINTDVVPEESIQDNEVETEEIIEEEVIEEGILEPSGQYTLSRDELRQLYIDSLLSLSAEQTEESYQYIKK